MFKKLTPPSRVLMGPGPSDTAPSVLQALASPTLGHLDPLFLQIMDETRAMLRAVFETENELTFPMSGTGSAGMETCFVNLVEPGDPVLIGINGVFGTRMKDVAERCGALVTVVQQEWGRAFELEQFRKEAKGKKFKLLCLVHAETSTGVLQDLDGFRALADEMGALFLVDAVTSLGGMPVKADERGMDAVYSGTQKCLSCPPGLSPVTFSKRATDALSSRKGKVQSWYLDLSMIRQYWGTERVYHHTAPINMIYGLHEALRLVMEEGLETRFARHRLTSKAFAAGLEAMGLSPLVPTAQRLPSLMAVQVPEGIDELKVRKQLLEQFGLEIGGGLGPLKGKIWRVGLMGAGSTRRNITLCLTALQTVLGAQGFKAQADPLEALRAAYDTP